MGSRRNSGTNPKTLATPIGRIVPTRRRSRGLPDPRGGHAGTMATATRPGPSPASPTTSSSRDATGDPEHGLKRSRRGPRPHRAGHRRGHRHRHLRHHRRGHRRRRPVDHHLLRPGGRHVPVLGLLLRRAGLVDPGLGQRLHLRLRDARRARRVDHRLGPDPRVRRRGGRGGRRLGRLPEVAAGLALRHHHPGVDRRAARRRRDGQPARRLPRARGVGAAHLRRARERAHEHVHGHHRRSPSSSSSSSSAWARSTATTSRRGRPTASTARSTRPR